MSPRLISTDYCRIDRGRTILALCRMCQWRALALDDDELADAIDRHMQVVHRFTPRRRGSWADRGSVPPPPP